MRYGIAVVDGPEDEPLTLAELKAHLRVDADDADENALIQSLGKAAREQFETLTGVVLLDTVFDVSFDAFPADGSHIRLPRAPVSAVGHVKYIDTAGDEQTWAAANYILDVKREPARLATAYNVTWPSTQDRINAVTVRFTAGYGATAELVPDDIKAALKLMLGHWYVNREETVIGVAVAPLPFAARAIADRYKLSWL